MRGKLNTIKNLAWALAIGVALLALLLGLLFATFTRYGGEMERPQVQLGELKTENGAAAATAAPDAPVQTATGQLITLPETKDAGQGYIDSLLFLCDSATIGLRDYGLLSDGLATTQVWGSQSGSLPVSTLADCLIRYPSDASQISPADAAMVSKPSILVISVGQDGLAEVDQQTFIRNYEALIQSIRTASPGTILVCCSITNLGPSYAGADGLTRDGISWANDWIQQVCKDTGAYFCDVSSTMRDSTNVLDASYTSANGKTLNSAGLHAWLDYIRTHAVQ
ncbi:MAG: SGNH/GDSL hydrolase family protein [Oscillospiraceae bacterium]|nr:SGNH/GDSL hydrolase family protein [Oscillospiraceae bacterium]